MVKNNILPISVFIITKNEEERITSAINSVINFVDEVIVVDSGSTDNTLKIAEQLGARVMFNQWSGFGQQKNFAEQQCRNDWILNIDADERVEPKLATEIAKQFKTNNIQNYVGFKINIAEIPHFISYPQFYTQKKYYLRLYNKKFCSYRKNSVHDSVVTSYSNILNLKHFIIHRSIRSYNHQIDKLNFYSSCQAEDTYKKGKRVSNIKIIFTPITAFLKHYILRKYFLYGIEGFIESWIYALSRLTKYAKIKEIYRKKENEDN